MYNIKWNNKYMEEKMGKLKDIILGSLIGTMAIGMSPIYVYANETINARVEARYSSNRISWNKAGDHDRYSR